MRVTINLRTGGGLTGTVASSTEHGLIVVQEDTPYVFGWGELTTASAYATRRALLIHERSGLDRMSASDHFDLGRFALWLGREDLAGREFAKASSLNRALAGTVRDAFARYQRRRAILQKEQNSNDPSVVTKTIKDESKETTKSDIVVSTDTDVTVPGLLPDQRTAVRDVYLRFGKKVQEVLGDHVVLVESDHFLIWTDWQPRYHALLADWCDAMYVALCRQFGLNDKEDIFLAKCPVFCFRSQKRFREFATKFDGFDASNATGYTRSIEANGHTHVVVHRHGSAEADFNRAACTLVHEGTHAFVHRLYSTKLIPHWVNEGLAEMMSERILGELCPAAENASLLATYYVEHNRSIEPLLESASPIDVHEYPLAHSLVLFLQTKDDAAFSGFIKDLKMGASVTEALANRYAGWTPDDLETQWRAWVRNQIPGSDGNASKENDSAPLFVVRRSVDGVDYRNVCGSKDQIPILEQNGQGVGIIDFDNDGWADLFVPNGSTVERWRGHKNPGCRLYRNLGDWKFEDVTATADVRGNAWSNGVAVADYDADGDLDIYVLNWGPNTLYRNNGDGTFTDVTTEAGVGDARWSSSAAFADFNHDGKLDIYVSNYVRFDFDDYPTREKDGQPCLYRGIETGCGPWCYDGQRDTLYIQVDKGRFADRSEQWGLSCTNGFRGFGVVAADLDNDGDTDVYVGCDVMANLRLENNGHGRFDSVGGSKGGAYNDDGAHESGMGVGAADFDQTGTLDLLTTNFAGEKNTLYLNDVQQWHDASATVGLGDMRAAMGWGINAEDFNGDGYVDLFIANGHIYPQVAALNDETDHYAQSPFLYLNNHRNRLVLQNAKRAFGGSDAWSLRGSATADFDRDGDLDIVAMQHNGPLVFFENRSIRPCLSVELIDRNGGRSPMGARLMTDVAGYRWMLPNQGYQSSNEHRVHLAMPNGRSTVWVEVRWPDGSMQDVRVDWPRQKRIVVRQPAKKE